MTLGGSTSVRVGRVLVPGGLVALILSAVLLLDGYPASAADVSALIKKLDRSEWEIVKDEVTARLPGLIATEQEQAALQQILKSSQQMAGLAQAYEAEAEDYDKIQEISTVYLAENLDAAVAAPAPRAARRDRERSEPTAHPRAIALGRTSLDVEL